MPERSGPSLRKAIQCPLLAGDVDPWIRRCAARFLSLAWRLAGDDKLMSCIAFAPLERHA